MDIEKRKALEQRRRELQVHMETAAFVESDLKPYLEILDELNKRDIPFRVVQLMPVKPDWFLYVEAALQQSPYREYGFDVDHLNEQGVSQLLDTLFDRHASINPFRYVPDLPRFADYSAVPLEGLVRDGLHKAVTSLALHDQKIYLYYLRYAPIIEVSLFELIAHDHEDLFCSWHGDALLFAPNLDWLIVFTLKEEWLGGKG